MTTISNGYINALLADATYALSNKPTGYTSAELKGLSALKERKKRGRKKRGRIYF